MERREAERRDEHNTLWCNSGAIPEGRLYVVGDGGTGKMIPYHRYHLISITFRVCTYDPAFRR